MDKKHIVIILEAFIVALISCILEIILAFVFDELSFYTWIYRSQPGIIVLKIIEFGCIFALPVIILLTNAVNYIIHKRKKKGTYVLIGAIAGVFHIILLLTLFQIACYIIKIGEGFGEGLLLVAMWGIAIVVSALYTIGSGIVAWLAGKAYV